MNEMVVAFSFQDAPLRVERGADGEPLFHAGDLCAILGYANPRDAVRRHVDAEDVVRRDTPSAGGIQTAKWIREPGMWALVFGSETAAARPVKRWVTAEVLPSIRKTGTYTAPGATVAALTEQVARLQADVAGLKRRKKTDASAALQARVAAWLVRWRPPFCNPDWIARECLHKTTITASERTTIKAAMRQAGYGRGWA
jgi:prophage antirepressor-like protein